MGMHQVLDGPQCVVGIMTRWGHEVGGGRAYQHEEEVNFRARGEVAHELLWEMGYVGDGDHKMKINF